MSTPGERKLQAQIAALTRWANTDNRTAATAAARAGMWRKFEDQVDPNRELTEAERTKRVLTVRKLHYAQIARKSVKARAARKGAA